MRDDILQEKSCALCGSRLAAAVPPDIRDEALRYDEWGTPPLCADCESRLRYADDGSDARRRP